MHHKTITSHRDGKTFKQYLVFETTMRSLTRMTLTEDAPGQNWHNPYYYEPETVSDNYLHEQLSAVIGPQQDGTTETFMCTDTNQFVVRGWFTYQDRKWFWGYSYIGEKAYKADVDRCLEYLFLSMGVKP